MVFFLSSQLDIPPFPAALLSLGAVDQPQSRRAPTLSSNPDHPHVVIAPGIHGLQTISFCTKSSGKASQVIP